MKIDRTRSGKGCSPSIVSNAVLDNVTAYGVPRRSITSRKGSMPVVSMVSISRCLRRCSQSLMCGLHSHFFSLRENRKAKSSANV